jgi:hypothetical protein
MPPADARTCRFCSSELKPGAIYCLACKQFQSRIRNALSSFSPPFLLSFVALIGLVYAYAERTFLLARPVIEATAVSCAADKVTLAVENYGTRPAVLAQGKATLPASVEGAVQVRKLWDSGLPLIIDPNTSRLVGLEVYSDGPGYVPSPMPARSGPCQYRISMRMIDFPGAERGPGEIICPCS